MPVRGRMCPEIPRPRTYSGRRWPGKCASDIVCAGQRPKLGAEGAGSKTVGSAYVGSNPTPATLFQQVKAGVTGWWRRLLRAVASGLWTVGEGLWASCGPNLGIGPLFDSCSISWPQQVRRLLSAVLFRGPLGADVGLRAVGGPGEIHGRIADGLGPRRAVGVAAGFPGVARSGVTAGFPRTGTDQVLRAARGRG